jgi:hypothetical protein
VFSHDLHVGRIFAFLSLTRKFLLTSVLHRLAWWCLLIVALSSLPARSFPELVHCTPSTIPSCLIRFRQGGSFRSPVTPSKAPHLSISASAFETFPRRDLPSTSAAFSMQSPSRKSGKPTSNLDFDFQMISAAKYAERALPMTSWEMHKHSPPNPRRDMSVFIRLYGLDPAVILHLQNN